MAKYRKRPVEVRAVQYIEGKTSIKDICVELRVPVSIGVPLRFTSHGVYVDTLEGLMKVDNNDYIIRGIKGEFYPCKPDIFELSYEGVDEQWNT